VAADMKDNGNTTLASVVIKSIEIYESKKSNDEMENFLDKIMFSNKKVERNALQNMLKKHFINNFKELFEASNVLEIEV
jgi:hypothetical protein